MKLILVVRNPITRAISDYTQTLANRKNTSMASHSFEELVTCRNRSWNRSNKIEEHNYLSSDLKKANDEACQAHDAYLDCKKEMCPKKLDWDKEWNMCGDANKQSNFEVLHLLSGLFTVAYFIII
uniref:Uncharacterized protein n=1 Tax=Ditylenchus dipsaci TaxID=166011 RepID=A0A915DLY3_9BILA